MAMVCSMLRCSRFAVLRIGHVPVRYKSIRNKVMTADDAVHLIRNGDTVTVGGFVAQSGPEEILSALGRRFQASKRPNNLTLLFGAGPADWKDRGLNHFGHEGMTRRVIGGHYAQSPMLAALIQENKIVAYQLPLGSISRMIRAAAIKSPGHITKVGFGTMADPKFGGGKLNALTTEDLVEELEVLGEKYLIYKAVPVDVAIVRGTSADPEGNITMDRESLYADNLIQAMAARAAGGIVLAQVERIAPHGSLPRDKIRIPATLVDAVVPARPENHWMSYLTEYDPAFAADPAAPPAAPAPLPLDERKLIARRALLEVAPNQAVNLGIGMPEGVALAAEEEGVLRGFTLTTEPGVHGGVGASGGDFGPARGYDALIDMNQQFDFYGGGGLDACFLGMAEVTARGDVNVTRLGPALKGPGGFIDISQSTPRVNLLGTFTAGGLEVAVEGGRLVVRREGRIRKFVRSVPEATFSGATAAARGQRVRYITERCVFALAPGGLELVEIAPGIDLRTQVLDLMDFEPIMRRPPRLMDPRIFAPGRMGLLASRFSLDVAARLRHDVPAGTLYVDLSGASLADAAAVEAAGAAVEGFFAARPGLSGAVDVFVNYAGFDCRADLVAPLAARARALERAHYRSVRRVAPARFARRGLADAAGIELREAHPPDEVFHLLRSVGLDLTREVAKDLCARWGGPGGAVPSGRIPALVEALLAEGEVALW